MRFLIIHDTWKPEAGKLAQEIEHWCKERNIAVENQPSKVKRIRGEKMIALVLGGDGFITKNALLLAKKKIPFLGINFGTVGFLAVAEPVQWEEAIVKILEGRYSLEERKLLTGVLETAEGTEMLEAVNDIVLFRGLQKFIRMQVKIDGHEVYKNIGGDGIIISSSIGSTAYNLAAGGPISEGGLLVTPIAVHRIDIAPLVLKEERTVEVTVLGGSKALKEEFVLEVGSDNTRRVKPGDKIGVKYGKLVTRFIVPEGFIFIQALQEKLGLSK